MKTYILILNLIFVVLLANAQVDPQLKEQVKPLSPEAFLKTVEIPEGYKLQLVASEPMIHEPVLCVWDGNGRMYVAQLDTYMQDAEGTGESEATSRVMLLEDTDGDGVMDKSSVFAKDLVLPRMILPLDERIIIGETHTSELYAYTDTDGDGVSDKKELWLKGKHQGGNMEHQASGLVWNIDNWIYRTTTGMKYRYTRGKVETKNGPSGRSQWSLDHDDRGRMVSGHGGGEQSFKSFQQPWRYGSFEFKDELEKGFMEVWPIDNIPDTQGGLKRIRENNTLNHFTAGCGHSTYRDTLMPELNGNLFICEPVGRMVRRATVENKEGVRILHNPYEKSEFIRSTDPNFRPVNTKMGPDGCLYIVDMYRGIIQQANWTKRGYLRNVIDKYGMAETIGRGRIYRLVPTGIALRSERPKMLSETPNQLLSHLNHPNGWWRDTARKLIILRGDKSVASELEKMVSNEAVSALGRVAAIWTLEGLDSLSIETIKDGLTSTDIDVQIAAAQAGEPFLKGDKGVMSSPYVKSALSSKSEDVKTQMYLSIYNYFDGEDKAPLVEKLLAGAKACSPRVRIKQYYDQQKKILAKANAEKERLNENNKELAGSFIKGKIHYQQFCVTCHGKDGKGSAMAGTDTTLGAPLVGSARVLGNYQRLGRIVLTGLQGPIDGKSYPGMMATISSRSDEYIADVLNYMRNEWGNKAPLVTVEQIAEVRKETEGVLNPWTLDELNKEYGNYSIDKHLWKLNSSHSGRRDDLKNAVKDNRNRPWVSSAKQKIGMWLSLEFDGIANLKGLTHNGTSPEGIDVEISIDGKKWTKILSQHEVRGKGKIYFKNSVEARFVKLSITKPRKGFPWVVYGLSLVKGEAEK